ncbi:hypothetical protein Tco_0551402 [Tanacetum coccineum]
MQTLTSIILVHTELALLGCACCVRSSKPSSQPSDDLVHQANESLPLVGFWRLNLTRIAEVYWYLVNGRGPRGTWEWQG